MSPWGVPGSGGGHPIAANVIVQSPDPAKLCNHSSLMEGINQDVHTCLKEFA